MQQQQGSERKTTMNAIEICDSKTSSTAAAAAAARSENVKLRGHDKSCHGPMLPSAPPASFRLVNRPYSCDVESLSPSRLDAVQTQQQQQHGHHHHPYFFNHQATMRQQSANAKCGNNGRTRGRRLNASYQQLTSVIDNENADDDFGDPGKKLNHDVKQPPLAVQEDFGLEHGEQVAAATLAKKNSNARSVVRRMHQNATPYYVNLPSSHYRNQKAYHSAESASGYVAPMPRSASQCELQRSDDADRILNVTSSSHNRLQRSTANSSYYTNAASDSNVSTKALSSSHASTACDQRECLSSNYYSSSAAFGAIHQDHHHQRRQLSDDGVAQLMGSSSNPASASCFSAAVAPGAEGITGRDYGSASSIDRLAPPHQPRSAVSNVAAEAFRRPQAASTRCTSCVAPPPPPSSSASVSKQQQQQQKQNSLPIRNSSVTYSGRLLQHQNLAISVTSADEERPGETVTLNAAVPENSDKYERDQKPPATRLVSQKQCQQQQTQQPTPRGSLRRGKAVDLTYYAGESQSSRTPSSSTANQLSIGSSASSSQNKEKLQSASTGRKGGSIFRKLIGGGSGSCSKSTSAEEGQLLSASSGTMTSGGGVGGCRAGSSVGLGLVADGSSSTVRADFSSDSCDFKYDERVRKRIFAHYDCASICADAKPLLTGTSRLKDANLNAATGASQASKPYFFLGSTSGGSNGVQPKSPQGETPTSPMGAKDEPSGGSTGTGEDRGDGKSNDLVLTCPYFRNECGGEPIRYVSLCRDTYQQQQQQQQISNSYSSPNSSSSHPAGNAGTHRPIDEHLETWHRPATASEASVLENLSNVYLGGRLCAKRQPQLVIEHVDQGAFYYRHCFSGKAHQNYFGIDENMGPLAISVVRDKLEIPDIRRLGLTSPYIYRLIIRLSDLTTFRGAILEESLPSYQSVKESREQQLIPAAQSFTPQSPAGTPSTGAVITAGGSGGSSSTIQSGGQSGSFASGGSSGSSGKIPIKELLELVLPEMQISCLRLALPVPRTEELLLKLDEQSVYTRYKVGILYCRARQSTEEQMYNNETSSPAFDEFLDMLGQRVRLKGFDKYKGGLDSKGDTTGSYSVYTTYQQYEIMFHVSTMLPFTPQNRQQLSRKRHIGNDIVTVIFQEPDALPFSPHTVRSHFQHVFVVVRANSPNTDNVKYTVAVSRCKDVPQFGPSIPAGATFPKSKDFRDFLLTKIINAENAVHKSEKFAAMAARTRREFMRDLAENHVTSHTLEGSASGKIASKILGGSKRKDRAKPKLYLDSFCRGALVWDVQVLAQVEDFSLCRPIECHLGISADNLVLIERCNSEALFCTPTLSIIGWTSHGNSLKLYYDHADVIILRTLDDDDSSEIQEIIKRLQATVEIILRRNAAGQLGFHIQQEGIVSEVEMYGPAWQAGLRQGSRLVEICKVSVATLTYERMLELLRTSVNVRVLVVPPLLEDGSPRRGCEDPYCPTVLGDDSPFFNNGGVGVKPSGALHPVPRTKQAGPSGAASRPAPPSYEAVMARRPVSSNMGFGGGHAPTAFTQSMTVEHSPELRSIGATDYGYESGSGGGGNYVSSTKSLDDIQNRRDRRHSDDMRSASADQGGSNIAPPGRECYPNSARAAAQYPPDDRWQHSQQGPKPADGNASSSGPRTDTLSSTGSTASSEMSSDSADALGFSRHRPTRPSDLKRRVDKANSDTQQRATVVTPILERTVTDPCSSASGAPGNSSLDTTPRAPPLPPKTYKHATPQALSSSSGLGSAGASLSSSSGHLAIPGLAGNASAIGRESRCGASVEENLIRLINDLESAGQIEEAIVVSSALYQSLSETAACQATSSNTTPEGQGPVGAQFGRAPNRNVLLSPETERGIEWSSLVDAATRAIEGMTQRALSNNGSPEFSSYHLRLEAAAQRVKLLEEKVDRMQKELDKERECKHGLESEVLHLRDANRHLDEECKSAKMELRKFTEWFFNAVETSNGKTPPGGGGGGPTSSDAHSIPPLTETNVNSLLAKK